MSSKKATWSVIVNSYHTISNIVLNMVIVHLYKSEIKYVLLAVAKNRSLHVVHEAYFVLQYLRTALTGGHCYQVIGKWSNWIKTKMTMNNEHPERSHAGL